VQSAAPAAALQQPATVPIQQPVPQAPQPVQAPVQQAVQVQPVHVQPVQPVHAQAPVHVQPVQPVHVQPVPQPVQQPPVQQPVQQSVQQQRPAPQPQPMQAHFPAPQQQPVSAPPPSQPPSQPRMRGEDLIADLFESMHELHFQRDAVDAGDFVLSLALTKIPSRAGIVHFYDIDRREFIVGAIAGDSPPKLLARRHPEAEALLTAAMRKREPIVGDGNDARVTSAARFVLLGDVANVITAPVMQSGRFLGAIELVDATDGSFDASDQNALAYIAGQFADYLAEHGVVLDPERIQKKIPAP
jgi:hypothetical protein